jgi:hypothetical protein
MGLTFFNFCAPIQAMRGQGLNLVPGINLTAKPSRQRSVSLSEPDPSQSNQSPVIRDHRIQPKKNIILYPGTFSANFQIPESHPVAPSRTWSRYTNSHRKPAHPGCMGGTGGPPVAVGDSPTAPSDSLTNVPICSANRCHFPKDTYFATFQRKQLSTSNLQLKCQTFH